MAQPAMRAACSGRPWCNIHIYGRAWLADLLPYLDLPGVEYGGERPVKADCAIIFANSFRSAWLAWRAGIAQRWGYAGQWRRMLLTRAPRPRINHAHEHHRRYFLDLVAQLGFSVGEREVSLRLGAAARQAGVSWLDAHGLAARRTVCVAPGAQFGGAKRYLPEAYAAVLARLSHAGWHILVLGTKAERIVGERCLYGIAGKAYNAAGETSLAEALAVLGASRMLLCNDSGLMHAAAGLGLPVVAIFGATDPARTAPSGPRVKLLYHPAACSPCLKRECTVAGQPCMANVLPAEVAAACLAALT